MSILPIQGGSGDDKLAGGVGDDFIYGGAGNDYMFGDAGNDNLRGGVGDDHLFGGDGNDMLNGDAGADFMDGGAGDDTYTVDDAGDFVGERGGGGYDTVKASVSFTLNEGIERLDLQGAADLNATGNSGDNTLKGNTGDNVLTGLDGKDSISGGDGADTLVGGSGHDWYQGGNGADIFVLDGVSDTETAGAVNTRQLNSTSSDTITDFIGGQDHIQVNLADFAGINGGVLEAQYFTVGIAANADHAQFIFDYTHKALLWDADGTGSGKAVKVADITNLTKMQASDILVHQDAPTVLDFEDLKPDTNGFEIPGDYHGFSFTSLDGGEAMYVLDGTHYGDSGYSVLGTAVAFNPFAHAGIGLHATNGGDFLFNGVDLVSAWDSVQEVTLHGFQDGVEAYTQTFNIDNTSITHALVKGWIIDDLEVSVTSNGGAAAHTVFDNIAVTQDGIFPHG